ncbi:putative efflux pump antibiotic resistance protein [Lophium mytilinum]|uniref:Putative efflux pump antibiotic resistance protein n=1 Tax=Lophium mytilinum TaxID=390894 RepID=A0A6A6QDE1_9PEZI|nr:putative efflux pump antibiotic resistance protein [Lophium mytilinum]
MAALDNKNTPANSLPDNNAIEDRPKSPTETSTSDEKQNDHDPQPRPRELRGWKWIMFISAIIFSTFLYAVDGTVVAVLQPVIVEEFGHVQDMAWLSVAFLLCATSSNLAWGRVYGNFNAKWFYIFHVFIFEVGSAICGTAPSMNIMILGRAIAGIGGSGQYIGCHTLIAATTTMSERPIYVSLTGLSWGLGTVLGPVIGGAFSESSVGWRWAFYINLFIGAACAPAYIFLIPNKDPRPGTPLRARAAEMDYAGITLQAAALAALLLAVNLGGVTYPWNSGRIIALFVVSGLLFLTLGAQQIWSIFTTPARRIIPVQFFRSRTVLILFSCTAASGALLFFTRSDGPLDAGVRLLPFIAVIIVFIIINGALMSKLGYYMPWFLAGGVLAVVGAALMYTIDQTASESRVYGYTVLMGVGTGMFAQASFSVAQAVVEGENVAPAIAFITLAQFMGMTLSLALANAILLNSSQAQIQRILPDVAPAAIQGAVLGARSGLVQSLAPEVKDRVLGAIVSAIDKTYLLVVAGGALTAVLSLGMRRDKLFGGAVGVGGM